MKGSVPHSKLNAEAAAELPTLQAAVTLGEFVYAAAKIKLVVPDEAAPPATLSDEHKDELDDALALVEDLKLADPTTEFRLEATERWAYTNLKALTTKMKTAYPGCRFI